MSTSPASPRPEAADLPAFIGRQPIVDRHGQLVAYELLYRNSRENRAQVDDPTQATASVINGLVGSFGIEAALGPYLGFINVDADMLAVDILELLPADKVVLEILETVDITPWVVERCRALRDAGFRIALDDVVCLHEAMEPLLPLVDFIKVEVPALSDGRLTVLARALHATRAKLLAEKVDTLEQVQRCIELGFELFQGYYFARPVILERKALSPSEMVLLRLLGLVLSDADTTEIERMFKQAPELSVNLMRLTNSVAAGVPQKISSLRHAITVLGRRQLQRWLQLLLYSNPGRDAPMPSPLMLTAAARARFMELAAVRGLRDAGLAEKAFMTGILSLTPALFGRAIDDIIAELPVDAAVAEALTAHAGTLGRLLALAEEIEQPSGRDAETLAAEFGLNRAALNACAGEALAWSTSIGA